MSEFQREDRYIVLKMKRMSESQLSRICQAIQDIGLVDALTESVVVEADWPIFEQVWDMVQRLAEGRPQKQDELMERVERLEEAIRQEHLEIEAYAHLSSATVKEITDSLVYKNLDDMLEEKPQQRLAEIEAAAVEEYGSYKAKALLNGDDVMSPAEYAQQLQDKAKGKPRPSTPPKPPVKPVA